MGSREGAGTGSFRWSFLELDSRLIVIGGSRLYTSPNNGWLDWMPETSNCVSQSAHFEPPFHVKMEDCDWYIYIYTYILIALIIGNGGWLDSHMFRNTKMSLWKSGTVLLNRRSNDHSSPLPAASASMRHHTRRLPSVHKCVKMEISWIYKFASTKFELRKRVHWLHSSHAVFFRSGNPWKHHPVFILCLRSD